MQKIQCYVFVERVIVLHIRITGCGVRAKIDAIAADEDLSQYIL